MDNKVELELLGITYNQIESGVYAVILQEVDGNRRIPIVIGLTEAQSIECRLQNIITPRPLTHDLMANCFRAYGLAVKEVYIYRLENGIFAATLYLTDGERDVAIDSRSSDAISLAVRFGVKIFTDEQVLKETSFYVSQSIGGQKDRSVSHRNNAKGLSAYNITQLEKMLEEAVAKEQYEYASEIKKEIEKRNE